MINKILWKIINLILEQFLTHYLHIEIRPIHMHSDFFTSVMKGMKLSQTSNTVHAMHVVSLGVLIVWSSGWNPNKPTQGQVSGSFFGT
jgi:hypothetical protein